jgi:hypothetical protein
MKNTSETFEALKTYACNMPLKKLQHVQHPPIYLKASRPQGLVSAIDDNALLP